MAGVEALLAFSKIDEAKEEFDGNCVVEVCSVQASIPKDPAALWNAEFVQAEELFKQAPSVENCLRDNRNSGDAPDWLGNVIVAAYVAAVICLTLAYLLTYFHLPAGDGSHRSRWTAPETGSISSEQMATTVCYHASQADGFAAVERVAIDARHCIANQVHHLRLAVDGARSWFAERK